MKLNLRIVGLLLSSVLFNSTLHAQDFSLPWSTIDGGGAMFTTGGDWELSGTIGQPDAGTRMTGGTFELVGGFWAAAGDACSCIGDVDCDNDVDIQDLANLLSQFGATGGGLSADIDNDGDVDIQDLANLLSNFGVPC